MVIKQTNKTASHILDLLADGFMMSDPLLYHPISSINFNENGSLTTKVFA